MSRFPGDGALRLQPRLGGQADALLILLHGVGASPEAMIELAVPLTQAFPSAAIVAPAGFDPFDCGPVGRQWFSIAGVTEANRPARVAAVLPRLDVLVDTEAKRAGVRRDRTVVVGFSQGAILALHLAATTAPLAAVASLAGRLAGPVFADDGPRPPVLLSHGETDQVIPFARQREAAVALGAAGCAISLQRVPRHGHGIAPVQVERVIAHLDTALGGSESLRLAS